MLRPVRTFLRHVLSSCGHMLGTLVATYSKRPPLEKLKNPDISVHLLVSSKTWHAGLLAAISFEFFTERRWNLFIHEDGSLCDKARQRIEKVLPGVHVVSRKQGDEKVKDALANYPVCLAHRGNHNLFLKFFDKKNLLVLADKNTQHKSFLKYLNAFWSEDNNGWMLSKIKEKELKDFIASQKLQKISSDIKSRKAQDKYHREISESESDVDSDSSDDVKSKKSGSESDDDIDPRILEMLAQKAQKEKKDESFSKLEKEELEKRKIKEKNKFEVEK